jgi:hypothetical protein
MLGFIREIKTLDHGNDLSKAQERRKLGYTSVTDEFLPDYTGEQLRRRSS